MPAGRPSKYESLDLEQVRKVASRGWTDKEMADFFDVAESTWNLWKIKHDEFSESLKDWKSEADQRVERSLYEKAVGYTHLDTKFASFEGRITDSVEYAKHYAPDTTAAIYWLNNRQPDKWKNIKQTEISGRDGAPIQIDNLSDIQIEQKLKALLDAKS